MGFFWLPKSLSFSTWKNENRFLYSKRRKTKARYTRNQFHHLNVIYKTLGRDKRQRRREINTHWATAETKPSVAASRHQLSLSVWCQAIAMISSPHRGPLQWWPQRRHLICWGQLQLSMVAWSHSPPTTTYSRPQAADRTRVVSPDSIWSANPFRNI